MPYFPAFPPLFEGTCSAARLNNRGYGEVGEVADSGSGSIDAWLSQTMCSISKT